MEILFFSALAVGIIVGLIPGFGLFSSLALLYPLLISFSPIEILVFYAVMGSASQFTGSITASVLGIAGEASSVPATKEGPLLFSKNQGPDAIAFASIGSFIGTCLVAFLLYFSIDILSESLIVFYNNNFQTFLFLFVLTIIVFNSTNRIWLNIIYIILGFALANIGLTRYFVEPLTFGIESLSTGIPFISLALGFYSLPQVFCALTRSTTIKKNFQIETANFFVTLKKFKSVWVSCFRGSCIGMIAGMAPGLTTILASNLSYFVEKNIRKKKGQYDSSGDINCLVTAETANNSGFLTSLLPLLIFGIPIIASEALVLNLIEQGGTAVGIKTLIVGNMFETIVFFYLLSGGLSFIIAWYGVKYCLLIYRIPGRLLLIGIFLLSILSVFIFSLGTTSYFFNLLCLLIFFSVGYSLKKTDTSPVLFAFLIYPFLEISLYRFYVINIS